MTPFRKDQKQKRVGTVRELARLLLERGETSRPTAKIGENVQTLFVEFLAK